MGITIYESLMEIRHPEETLDLFVVFGAWPRRYDARFGWIYTNSVLAQNMANVLDLCFGETALFTVHA